MSRFTSSFRSYKAQRSVLVQKVKSKAGKKAVKDARRLQGIVRAMERFIVADLTRGFATFKRRIDGDEIIRLANAGKIDEAMRMIPWDKLPDDIRGMRGRIESAMISASEIAELELKAPKGSLRLDTANPRLVRWIDANIGRLIIEIQNEARKSVASIVRASLDQALTPKRAAKLVNNVVGITGKQTNNLTLRHLRKLNERGEFEVELEALKQRGMGSTRRANSIKAKLKLLTDEKIEEDLNRSAKRLQKHRSVTIARTELNRAVSQGQNEVWNKAADDGLISRESTKVWVTVADMDRSDVCTALDGQEVAMDEQFYSPVTGDNLNGPPAHPNCRSAVILKPTT